MDSHSRRLIGRLLHTMKRYTEGEIDKLGFLEDLTGTLDAIEEDEVQEETRFLMHEVEHAVWNLDEAKAIAFIKEWISRLERLCG